MKLARAHITKTFHGDLAGNSETDIITVYTENPAAYAGIERVERDAARPQGRLRAAARMRAARTASRWMTWKIVETTGTGDLAGIRGEGQIIIGPDGDALLHPRLRALTAPGRPATRVHGAAALGWRGSAARRGGRGLPATAAWPRLMPPSLGGTRACVSTRKPGPPARSTTRPSSSRFWNTPPDSATVPSPDRSRSRAQTADDGGGHAAVEPGRDHRGRGPGQQVLGRRPHQVGAADHAAGRRRAGSRRGPGQAGRVAAALGRVGQLLQLDRGLALVVDRVPHAQQRGDRVEQPARAGGERRVDARAAAIASTASQRRRLRPATARPGGGSPAKAASRYAAAIRHGCRIAAAPPGMRHRAPGARPARSRARSASRNSPPQIVPSVP